MTLSFFIAIVCTLLAIWYVPLHFLKMFWPDTYMRLPDFCLTKAEREERARRPASQQPAQQQMLTQLLAFDGPALSPPPLAHRESVPAAETLPPPPAAPFVMSTPEPAPVLPVPVVAPAAPLAWLTLDDEPAAPTIKLSDVAQRNNVAVIGATGSGKTTLLKTILAARQGEETIVLDPHNAPGKWPTPNVVGGGRRYPAIRAVLERLDAEMSKRFEDMDAGRVAEGGFPRRTTISDEFRSISQNIQPAGKRGQPDYKKGAGDYLLDRISEGRKVGETVLLACHNDTVGALGIEGNSDMKTCFDFMIFLGGLAIERYERRSDATPEQIAAVKAMARPAVAWDTERNKWWMLEYDLAPVLGPAEEPMLLELPERASQEQADDDGTGLSDAELVAELVRRGMSANKIAETLGGKRAEVLALVRQVKGESNA